MGTEFCSQKNGPLGETLRPKDHKISSKKKTQKQWIRLEGNQVTEELEDIRIAYRSWSKNEENEGWNFTGKHRTKNKDDDQWTEFKVTKSVVGISDWKTTMSMDHPLQEG